MTQETAVEISDEVVDVFMGACLKRLPASYGLADEASRETIRLAIQATIPLVVVGLVPSECTDEPISGDHYYDGYNNGTIAGWNYCRDDILAKVKK